MGKDKKKKRKVRKIFKEDEDQSETNKNTENEGESSSLGRLARFVDDEFESSFIFSDSASDDSKDYGIDDDEFLKEQEGEQKKKKSKESI